MPFAEIVKSLIVTSGAAEELVESFTMNFLVAPKGVMRSRKIIERKVDNAEPSGR